MGRGLTTALIALAAGGAAYFLVSYLLTRLSYRKIEKSKIQMAYLVIEEAERGTGGSLRDKIADRLVIAGWYGGLAPIILSASFLYTLCVLGMYVAGLNQILGIILAAPACAGVVALVVIRISTRRQIAFQRQLMSALGMLASQIEAGNGAERALEQILPSLEDPLGAELHGALASTVTLELVPALQEVARRYPSRAFTLFLAALEVDRLQGGALAPALREASSMLQRQFELSQEATAEISQAKVEFYAVGGIVAMIAITLLSSSDPGIRGAYFSPTGAVGIGIGLALAATGVLRAMKLLRKAKGGGE